MADSDSGGTQSKDGINGSTSQDKQSISPTSVPHNIRPNTLNTSGSDAYWFAHAADPPQERIPSRQNDTPTIERVDDHGDGEARRYLEDNQANGDSPGNQAAAAVAAATARARANLLSPGQNSEYKEDATPLSQREREERFRVFKERQEEERQRRLHELQQQSVLAQKFREQQEEERKRKIDELRQKDLERRMAVEERKRQIWEAEQERKEAILRRNLDREAKIEARRNAQRNSMSFAFGSSTPRVIDLDLGGFANRPSATNAFGSVTLMPAVNGRKIEDQNDLFKRRAPSTDLLDQKPDEIDAGTSHYVLSRSFNIPLDEGHSRSSTEPPSNRLNRRSCPGMSSEATRACLTIPDYNNSSCRHGQSPRMTTSHYDLWSNASSFGWLSGSGVIIGEDPMSRSMVILPSASRGRRRTDLTPTIPWERESSIRSHSPASSSGLSASKRAVSMSRLDILAQPRRRYVVDHSPSSSNIAASSSQGGTSGNTTPGGPRTTSMSKSMLNLANSQTFRRGVVAGLKRQPKGSGMSLSTLYIAGESPQGDGLVTRARCPQLPSTSPTRHAGIMAQSFGARSFASEPETSKRMSKSMIHLASKPPPRPTRAFRLRSANANAQAQRDGHSTSTVLALSPNRNDGTSSVSELRKESPSRPRSSMSVASEMSGTSSMTSTVSMRSHSGPRRPRPASMAAAIPDPNLPVPTPPQRQSRTADKKSVPVAVTPPRPPRAKSAGPDALPPPKPPPRRTSPSKSASSDQVTQLIEKPIASVLPNTVEATSAIEEAPKLEAEKLESPIEKPKKQDIIEKADKLDEPQKAIVEPSKPSVEPPKPIKQDKAEEPSIEQPIQPIPGTLAKPRITSEEEAKAALAEKRRLAREQAEREAKMERLRQEELKRQEEERIRLEEEEQRRLEEEQIKLAQELRRQEEEKLQRAIKEQEEREADERKRQEEEAKLKVEREEQEKKAREEAEKQRKEAEEKLKREEEERAERKKRVEQIMMRTRAKAAQAQKDEQNAQQKVEEQKTTQKELPTKKEDEISASEQNSVVSEPNTTGEMNAAPHANGRETSETSSTQPADGGEVIINSVIGDNKDSTTGAQPTKPSSLVEQNGLSQELVNDVLPEAAVVAKSLAESQNKIEHYNGTVIQTNGFNSDAYTQGKSSDVKGDPIVGNLLDFDSLPQGNVQSSVSGASSPPPPPTQFDEFIDLSQLATTTTTTQSHVASNENEVILFNRETDDLNSNRMVSNNPFIAFEDNVTKKQESSFTDLLS